MQAFSSGAEFFSAAFAATSENGNEKTRRRTHKTQAARFLSLFVISVRI